MTRRPSSPCPTSARASPRPSSSGGWSRPGDPVAVDAPVAEVETAKATVEVPSPFAGIVAELHGAEGATIAVGAPLITVRSLDGDAAGYVEEERAGSGNVLVGYGTTEAPRRRRHRQPAPEEPERPEDRVAGRAATGAPGRSRPRRPWSAPGATV